MNGSTKVYRYVDLVCPSCGETEKNEMIERYVDKDNNAIGDEEVLCTCGAVMKIKNGPPCHGVHSSFAAWNSQGMVG